jgi:N-acetylmuramoyl-L-alanine amidase
MFSSFMFWKTLGYQNFTPEHEIMVISVEEPYEGYEIGKQDECLIKNIYFEAKNESFEGKLAVAQVTINRVNSDKFPNTICNVVKQVRVLKKRKICQFSWYCMKPKKMVEDDDYNDSIKAAFYIKNGHTLEKVKTALFYHADYVNPKWKYKRITTIGKHIFYK